MFHESIRRRRHAGFHGQAASILDAEGHFVNVSPSLAAFYRIDAEALNGRSLLSCIPSDEAEQVEPLLHELAQGIEGAYQFQVQLRDPDGHLSWVQLSLSSGGQGSDGRPLIVANFAEPPLTIP